MATIATMIIIITCNTLAVVVVCHDYYIMAYLLVGEQESSLFFNGDVQPLFMLRGVGSNVVGFKRKGRLKLGSFHRKYDAQTPSALCVSDINDAISGSFQTTAK